VLALVIRNEALRVAYQIIRSMKNNKKWFTNLKYEKLANNRAGDNG
jgi:hypothetical protein